MDSKPIPFIFIGDTHGFIDDFLKQEEIIKEINPKRILSENMQDISLISDSDYKRIIKNKKISEMVSFEEVEKLISICKKRKISLIGIDFHNFGLDKKLQEIVKGERKPSNEELKEIDELIKRREKKHMDILKEYENKYEKPILILIGAWHLRESSPIMKSLNNYKIIFPCDKNGKMLLKPPKDGDVRYCMRVKNG